MIVWVASYPRSGNTLTLLALMDLYGVKRLGSIWEDDLALGSLPHKLVPEVYPTPWQPPDELAGLRRNALLEALRERPEPYFIKTHRLSEVSDPAPALYIVRDGRDSIISHAHFVAEQGVRRFEGATFNRRVAELITPGIPTYGTWSENVRRWRGRGGPTATIRFEELVSDPGEAVAAACAEIDVELGEPAGEMLEFDYLRERVPKLFRRGVVGAWRDEMAPHLQERFWRVHGHEMRRLGYHEPSIV